MLPGKDGFTVVAELRAAQQFVPVLMLTARGRPEDVLKGLRRGRRRLPAEADRAGDSARPHRRPVAAHASGCAARGDRYTFAGKTIDFDTLELRVGDRTLPLTLMEANLLRYLMPHEGKAVSRKAMLEEVWGVREDTDTRAIDNFIVRLRRYIETEPARPQHLLTVRGVGYRFVASPGRATIKDQVGLSNQTALGSTSTREPTYSCGAT